MGVGRGTEGGDSPPPLLPPPPLLLPIMSHRSDAAAEAVGAREATAAAAE